jgi:F-type H+-transporting ATPase subunit a
MKINPDEIIYFSYKFIKINATLVFTWTVMLLIVLLSWLLTRKIKLDLKVSKAQLSLELVISYIRNEIKQITSKSNPIYLYFVGSLFLFISIANFLVIFPGYIPPTGSLSTTIALAICVYFSVPIFGVKEIGFKNYFKHYFAPSVFMFPFHVLGELTRTFALAVRLFGNIMSGILVVGVLLSIAPLFFPILLQILGLLIGQIQAYIFSILAAIYIASGMHVTKK